MQTTTMTTTTTELQELRLKNKLLMEEKESWKFKYEQLGEHFKLNELLQAQEEKLNALQLFGKTERRAYQMQIEDFEKEIKRLRESNETMHLKQEDVMSRMHRYEQEVGEKMRKHEQIKTQLQKYAMRSARMQTELEKKLYRAEKQLKASSNACTKC